MHSKQEYTGIIGHAYTDDEYSDVTLNLGERQVYQNGSALVLFYMPGNWNGGPAPQAGKKEVRMKDRQHFNFITLEAYDYLYKGPQGKAALEKLEATLIQSTERVYVGFLNHPAVEKGKIVDVRVKFDDDGAASGEWTVGHLTENISIEQDGRKVLLKGPEASGLSLDGEFDISGVMIKGLAIANGTSGQRSRFVLQEPVWQKRVDLNNALAAAKNIGFDLTMQATLLSKVETQLEELKQAVSDMFTAAMRFEDYRGLNDVLAAASDMRINDKSLEKLMSDVKEKLVARRKEKEDMLQASNLEMESLSLDESGDVTSQGHSDDA